MLIRPDDHILFYGDSITDCGRRNEASNPSQLGVGYALFCAQALEARFPEWKLRFSNRGISGDRVYDLEKRLEPDVIGLRPTFVSILIGINDTWRRYDNGVVSAIPEFRGSYRRMLDRIQAAGARLLLCEPFLLPVPEDRRTWREDLDPRIQCIRELAVEFGASYLPLDGLFAQAATGRGAAHWLPDGVHPSVAGHGLIAREWVSLVTR